MPIFPSTPVSDPQISPSGEKIAFSNSEVNLEENKYDSHIWLVDEKKKPHQYTYGKTSESNPRWSPKGDRLIFVSARPGERDSADTKPAPQVFVIPTEGGEAMKLTYLEEGVMNPMWSPNGRKILFTSKVYKGEERGDSDVRLIRRMVYRFDGKGWYDP